jgi:hypothetical protein
VYFYENCRKLDFSSLDGKLLSENTSGLISTFVGREYENTLEKYQNIRHLLNSKTLNFIKHKTAIPKNGNIPGAKDAGGFGSSDKRFSPEGSFKSSQIHGISHAHITHDISIVYRIHDGRLDIFGFYNHDAIGTGNPANTRRQQQAAERWKNETFDTPLDIESLELDDEPAPKAASKVKKKPAVKPAPKSAPVPQVSSKMEFAKKVSDLWPQRQLYDKLTKPGADPATVIGNEARALISLFRGVNPSRIPANQHEYFVKFEELYKKF